MPGGFGVTGIMASQTVLKSFARSNITATGLTAAKHVNEKHKENKEARLNPRAGEI